MQLLSEKNNIQLASEKETIKNDMIQMADHYERTLKTKEIENVTLQNRIKLYKNDLDETKSSLEKSTEQLKIEIEEKKTMEKEWMKQKVEDEK